MYFPPLLDNDFPGGGLLGLVFGAFARTRRRRGGVEDVISFLLLFFFCFSGSLGGWGYGFYLCIDWVESWTGSVILLFYLVVGLTVNLRKSVLSKQETYN